MKRFILLLPIFLLVVTASVLQAITIHVPSQQPTIQAGIDAATTGDTVLVADGTYMGDGNRDIDFIGKAIVVMSENGPDSCIIDCGGSESDPHRGFHFRYSEDSTSIVQGFTITKGWQFLGGAIACDRECSPSIIGNFFIENVANGGGAINFYKYSSSIIRENLFIGNSAFGPGGAIRCSYSPTTIQRNIIIGNSAERGGGIYCNNEGSPNILNNTIVSNTATEGGGIFCTYSSPTIKNSILWGDSPDEISVTVGNPVTTYSDIQGGWVGEGNIDEDPLFIGGDPFDYHLTPLSPCIDAGDPNSPLDPDSTRADMGAYFFDQKTITLTAIPDTTHYHKGDTLGFTVTVNNYTDTTIFLQGWTELVLPDSTHISPLIEPISGVIGPQGTVVTHITQYIPYYAPYGGPYVYMVKVGEYPDEVYAEDSFELFVISPNIMVEVVSDTTHYHRGEMLEFTVTVTNNEDTTVYLDGWSEGVTPWGEVITPLLGPVGFVMGAGASITDYYQQLVPVNAPFGGPYIYRIKVGKYDRHVLGEDFFEFSIVPGLELSQRKYEDWEVVAGGMW